MITTAIVSPEKPKLEFNYPCLGERKGSIVLFTGPRIGVLLQKGESVYSIGEQRYDWISFTPCPPGTKVEIVQQ